MSEDEIEKLALEWLNDNTSATCAVYGEDALSLFALLRRVRDDAVALSCLATTHAQSEPQRMAAEYDRGVREERARIVEHHRQWASANREAFPEPAFCAGCLACIVLADWIERGEA